jgi:hypothetical protein
MQLVSLHVMSKNRHFNRFISRKRSVYQRNRTIMMLSGFLFTGYLFCPTADYGIKTQRIRFVSGHIIPMLLDPIMFQSVTTQKGLFYRLVVIFHESTYNWYCLWSAFKEIDSDCLLTCRPLQPFFSITPVLPVDTFFASFIFLPASSLSKVSFLTTLLSLFLRTWL